MLIQPASGQMVITEWMYSGTDGEFIEFTNIGTVAIEMSGWSFDDSDQTPGTVDLSPFGTVNPGESVILTETAPAKFAEAWGLTNVKIIGEVPLNLDRNDQINLYDSNSLLVDQLNYGDENYPGTPRTKNASCNIPESDYALTEAQKSWKLAEIGDTFGSRMSAGGDIASPGRIVGYALNDYDMDDDIDLCDLGVFASCWLGDNYPISCTLPIKEGQTIPADADKDFDVDLLDFAVFATCYSGEDKPVASSCRPSSNASEITQITLNGDSITIDGTGAQADGTTVTITSPGSYSISGTLNDGQIAVNSPTAGAVEIILNGVNITNSTNAAVNVIDAAFVWLVLADQTQNTLTDAGNYQYTDPNQEPSGCLFSNDSMLISGTGTLTVYGNCNDAIVSEDKLFIESGTIKAVAIDDGIRGKDALRIQGGDITLTTGGDALKSDNDSDPNLGYITIEGGSLDLISGKDGITAASNVTVTAGNIKIASGGGHTASVSDSAKGVKGLAGVVINGGIFTLDCADDAVHSNGSVIINSGTFEINTGDDGIHADNTVLINGGTINVANSYEGIESAVITINNGTIHITSGDDGINVAGGNDGSGEPWPPQPGSNTGNYFLYINGGHIVLNTTGDGIDANGSITITGGTILVNGPTVNFNNAVDFDGTCNMSGGFLVAVGSSQMAQALSTTSTQCSLKITYRQWKTAGTLIHIAGAATGEDILTFAPLKSYQSCVFSAPSLKKGTSYKLYMGGNSTGTAADGLYQGGIYTPGTLTNTFTINNIVTNITAP
ncbi:MAG TPA: carbohydrate-binding domain-containing protein [Anaerohalosphaeraceae bacterium]|nr:carbohydrate-binding domain-containing protein [Anaerohalosphaeraceae bacterium]HOL90090.1 carbohydrate-binding domain-containing protein [Anaerohalosphaeraceae bacterium]HPP57448.1 carbohydrate-binding domain-containing protein [Anaerohalosphaeraceae bacterium]